MAPAVRPVVAVTPTWACHHCAGETWPVDSWLTGERTVLEVRHEPGCPDAVDEDGPAAEYVVDGDGVRDLPAGE